MDGAAPMRTRRTRIVPKRAWTAAALAVVTACGTPPPVVMETPSGRVIGLDEEARRWVDETLASLTLEELVGQLVIEWIPGGYVSPSNPDFEPLERWVMEDRIGGV